MIQFLHERDSLHRFLTLIPAQQMD